MNFEYMQNEDGSFGLYNTDIGDIYFSNVGAYKEALEKFVLPSFSYTNSFQNKKKIKILDVCYGMGYNSKTFLNYVYKNNFNFEIEIDAVEVDKNILALGLFLADENIDKNIHLKIGKEILSQYELGENLEKISGENWIKYILPDFLEFFKPDYAKNMVDLYQNNKINTFLHNIYYQPQQNVEYLLKKLKFSIILNKLEEILSRLSCGYDLIFHDAFSILKQPELWSEEIIHHYFKLLNYGGLFLTYSNSRVLRRRLVDCGFEVIVNTIGDRKQNGTIGRKI